MASCFVYVLVLGVLARFGDRQGVPVPIVKIDAAWDPPDFDLQNEAFEAFDAFQDCALQDSPSYSQSNEDQALFHRYFRSPLVCHGVFVEIGALDGIRYSNSYFFERALGWKSILIEANPISYEQLVRNRPGAINVHAAMCPGRDTAFIGTGATGGVVGTMSSAHGHAWLHNTDKAIRVPCKTFNDIFSRHGITHINVFVVDVEGGELSVLQAMDWRVRVDVWVIELDGTNNAKDLRVRHLLLAHGYVEADWNIRDSCIPGNDCASNVVFVAAGK
jgi:FkbM family methyltransferase